MDATGPSARDVGTRLLPRAGVCAALLGSALVRATVVSEDLDERLVAGLFFLLLEVGEVGLALASLLAWGSRTAQLVPLAASAPSRSGVCRARSGCRSGPRTSDARERRRPATWLLPARLLAAALAFRTAVGRPASRDPDVHRLGAPGLVVAVATALTAWGLHQALAGRAGRHGMPSGPGPRVTTASDG